MGAFVLSVRYRCRRCGTRRIFPWRRTSLSHWRPLYALAFGSLNVAWLIVRLFSVVAHCSLLLLLLLLLQSNYHVRARQACWKLVSCRSLRFWFSFLLQVLRFIVVLLAVCCCCVQGGRSTIEVYVGVNHLDVGYFATSFLTSIAS